jgi:hypothetical protein
MQKKKKILNEEKEKGKSKKEERTGGVRPHGGVQDPLPVRLRHRSLRATGCPIGFAHFFPSSRREAKNVISKNRKLFGFEFSHTQPLTASSTTRGSVNALRTNIPWVAVSITESVTAFILILPIPLNISRAIVPCETRQPHPSAKAGRP